MKRSAFAFILVSGAFASAPALAQTGWGTAAEKGAPAITTADIDKLRDAVAVAWEKAPLSARRAMFVTRASPLVGDYDARAGNVFKPGEKLVTYAEPVGYTWKPNGDRFEFGVIVDFVVKSADGQVLGGQEKFAEFRMASRMKLQEFMLNLTLSLDGAAPGSYVLRYTLHDINSPKTFSFEQPFVIGRAAD